MAASNLNFGKASGGVLNIQPADGTTTTSLILPAINGTVVAADSNGNVGIGITPSEKLSIYNGSASNTFLKAQNTLASSLFGIDTAGFLYAWSPDAGAAIVGTSKATGVINFYSGGGQKAQLGANGSFIIGASSPTAQRYVSIDGGNTGTADGAFYKVMNNGGNICALGNYSSIIGGAYDNTATVWSNNSLKFITGGGANVRATIDSAGNVGIGVTPSANSLGSSSVELPSYNVMTDVNSHYQANNVYHYGGWKYKNNGYALMSTQDKALGQHKWYTAPSGTAGNTITWNQAMLIESNTHTTIGTPIVSTTTGAQLRVEQAANNDTSTASLIISRYSDNYSSALWHCYNATYNQEAFNLSVSPAGGGSSLTTSYKKYMALGNGNHFWYGATTSNQTMILDSTGQLTITPSSSTNGVKVQSNTTTGVSFWTSNAQSGSTGWYHLYGTSANNTHADIAIYGNGNVVNANNSYGAISDIKLKENIVDTTPKLDKLMKIRVVNYNLINDGTKQIGVIAQEVEKIFPSIVEETKDIKQVEVEKEREITLEDGTVDIEKYTEIETVETGEVTKNVKYSVIYMMMLKAMQEQQEIINDLKSRIEILEAK